MISDVMACSKRIIQNEDYTNNFYFIVAHTYSGDRFYSEPFNTFTEANNVFSSYESMIKYFGGGTVEILYITDFDFDVIMYSRV